MHQDITLIVKATAYRGQDPNIKYIHTASNEPNCKTPSGSTGTSTIVCERKSNYQLKINLNCAY